MTENVEWAKTFQVYPRVRPPPADILTGESIVLDETAKPGRIEVLVGPVFDLDAYNAGAVGNDEMHVKSYQQRGILSFDEQYDAFNFVYYVERAADSYQMKPVTNRLSFYINSEHGARVFPRNIETQLSLLLWRRNDYLKNFDGTTNQKLLGYAIKSLIPRILYAVIMEVVKGRSNALPERVDQALRTYLLIHQVCQALNDCPSFHSISFAFLSYLIPSSLLFLFLFNSRVLSHFISFPLPIDPFPPYPTIPDPFPSFPHYP